jgi:hypothetical protein
VSFLDAIWTLLEPSAPGRFPNLERHLLRRALRASGVIAPRVEELEGIGLEAAEARQWQSFLSNPDDSIVLAEADKTDEIDSPRCHLQVIARAVFLLCLSTYGATRHLKKRDIGEQI